ncbi:MAG: TRAP transporter substrate-binding protein DctP [Syntrophorhabdaceae bacterium]|nr:TRAP transporter substrate-binding protein DctP [Syntrophorhabdaceae bacterium]MDD5244738.1 TRAP transporter substrate-binding protein DctP [Syntrophorhabdaceae bacterium]
MKKCLLFGLCLIFVVAFGTPSFAQNFVLKGITFAPRNEAHLTEIPMLIDMIKKESNGQLKINWVGGPEVIPSFDQSIALKNGTIDMLLYYPFSYFTSMLPVADAKGISQLSAWEERKNGCYDLWVKVFREKVNAEYLGCLHSVVPLRIYTRKNIKTLADFKGMKIRVMPLYVPLLKALGAVPVMMPGTEIHTAMERGVVDGFMWGGYGIKSLGLEGVTKFVIEPGIFQLEAFVGINLAAFNKLPKDLQVALKRAVQKMEPIATENAGKIAAAELDSLQKMGIKIAKLPAEDAKKLRDLSYETTWKKVIAEDPVYGPQFKKLTTK